MQPVAGGFYCDECCKVVIDFREKSNEEILAVLRNRRSEKLCGYFHKSQASRGKLTFQLARFAAAVLLVFGSVLFVISTTGCGGGLKEPDFSDTVINTLPLQVDSVAKTDSVTKTEPKADSTK